MKATRASFSKIILYVFLYIIADLKQVQSDYTSISLPSITFHNYIDKNCYMYDYSRKVSNRNDNNNCFQLINSSALKLLFYKEMALLLSSSLRIHEVSTKEIILTLMTFANLIYLVHSIGFNIHFLFLFFGAQLSGTNLGAS